jgi:hypothetical protein
VAEINPFDIYMLSN